MHTLITCACDPLGTTGHVWRKSPNKMTAFPPKARLLFMTHLETSSIHVKAAQFSIEASSNMIRPVWLINSPQLFFFGLVKRVIDCYHLQESVGISKPTCTYMDEIELYVS